jgi:hypothetical protein
MYTEESEDYLIRRTTMHSAENKQVYYAKSYLKKELRTKRKLMKD